MILSNIEISIFQSLVNKLLNIIADLLNIMASIWQNPFFERVILPASISIFVSISVLIIWEWATAPKLKISKDTDWGEKYYNEYLMYYHLNVKNKKCFFMPTRKPAMSCRIEIEVFKENGNKIKLNKNKEAKFYARWRYHPEPIFLDSIACGITLPKPDYTKIYTLIENNIYTHKDEPITIFIKHKGENDFYLFNNESFFYLYNGYKHDLYRLGIGIYFLRLKVFYKKKPYEYFFKIMNSGKTYSKLDIDRIKFPKFSKEIKRCLK